MYIEEKVQLFIECMAGGTTVFGDSEMAEWPRPLFDTFLDYEKLIFYETG